MGDTLPVSPLNELNLFEEINLPINNELTSASTGHYVPPFEFGIAGRAMYSYQWIFVFSCILAFICAAGIGANDVANSFATSVGSKTLKMWHAVLIASICEFLGAYLLGARVTTTIRSGIVSVNAFTGHDDLLMFGMMCSILCVGAFLFVATALELPVSTTHSIVGAIVGFALCSPSGGSAVQWVEIGKIVASWFASPIIAGAFSALFFITIRWLILRRTNSLERVFIFFPILVFLTVTLNVIFILFKGGVSKGQGVSAVRISDGASVGIAFGVGGLAAIITILLIIPIRRYITGLSEEKLILLAVNKGTLTLSDKDRQRLFEIQQARIIETEASKVNTVPSGNDAVNDSASLEVSDPDNTSAESSTEINVRSLGRIERGMDRMFRQSSVHLPSTNNATVANIHDKAEVFPLQTEFALGYLQVATACFASFAHGANDVANSIGPLAAVNAIYTQGPGSASKSSPVPDWILLLGGGGLVFGLALYGHKIISAMGVKVTKITPARGFCAELSVALVIVIGSFLGLPLSSTHCAVGAIVGLGLAERRKDALNWKLLGKVALGWIFTLVIAGSFTAAIFSWSTFAPSQVYPLSLHNCLSFYGDIKNVSNGDPTSFTQEVNAAGTVTGVWGYPSNGSTFTSL